MTGVSIPSIEEIGIGFGGLFGFWMDIPQLLCEALLVLRSLSLIARLSERINLLYVSLYSEAFQCDVGNYNSFQSEHATCWTGSITGRSGFS